MFPFSSLLKEKNAHNHMTISVLFFVPRAGIEPARICIHWCLRPARLPIPPSGRFVFGGANITAFCFINK